MLGIEWLVHHIQKVVEKKIKTEKNHVCKNENSVVDDNRNWNSIPPDKTYLVCKFSSS